MSTMTEIPKLQEISLLKGRLLALPGALYKARTVAFESQMTVQAVKEEIAQAEAETLLLVQGETKGDGKAAFSNEAARAAEVTRRLAGDVEHRDRLKRLSAADSTRMDAELQVKLLEDEHKAWRAHVDLTCAEVQLLVAGR